MTTTTKRGPGRPPKAQAQQANGQVALSLEANGLEAPEPTPGRSPGQAARKPKTPKPEKDKSLETWIWDAACSIRGAKDAPKYKDYILPLIFTKRLCDVFDDELDRIAGEVGSREKAFRLVKADKKLVRFYLPLEPKEPADSVWSVIRTLSDKIGEELIPFRIADPPKDAPLFFRRTIRGGRCVAVATGLPPRRSNAEKEQVDRVDLYCELVLPPTCAASPRQTRCCKASSTAWTSTPPRTASAK